MISSYFRTISYSIQRQNEIVFKPGVSGFGCFSCLFFKSLSHPTRKENNTNRQNESWVGLPRIDKWLREGGTSLMDIAKEIKIIHSFKNTKITRKNKELNFSYSPECGIFFAICDKLWYVKFVRKTSGRRQKRQNLIEWREKTVTIFYFTFFKNHMRMKIKFQLFRILSNFFLKIFWTGVTNS